MRPTAKELMKHDVFNDEKGRKVFNSPYKINFDDENESYMDHKQSALEKACAINDMKVNVVKEHLKFKKATVNLKVKFLTSTTLPEQSV